MPGRLESGEATVTAIEIDGGLDVVLGGVWQVTVSRPTWGKLLAGREPRRVRLRTDDVAKWDTSLLLFLIEAQEWCRVVGAYCDTEQLPEKIRTLLGLFTKARETSVPFDRSESFLMGVGHVTIETWERARTASTFLGESVIGVARLVKRPRMFRWHDCLEEIQQCGAMALPIVGLISFLVGWNLAYQGAVQLRQFGADIFVADLVGLGMVREMGPLMAAIIMAGRTGAAFAATLANMKANEEVDALETLGIPPIFFLVLPRLVALTLMMPLLALYANCLGILGGMTVGAVELDIPPAAYWIETQSIIDMSDVSTGLMKALAFGVLISLAGCLRGLQAERSASGVGRAATSAVVTSLLVIIVANAFFAVVFNRLGW